MDGLARVSKKTQDSSTTEFSGAAADTSAARSVVVSGDSAALVAMRAWDPVLLDGVSLDIAEAARAQLAALKFDGPKARGCALGGSALSGRYHIEEANRAAKSASTAALRAERRNARKAAKLATLPAAPSRKAYNRMPGVYGLLSAIAKGPV